MQISMNRESVEAQEMEYLLDVRDDEDIDDVRAIFRSKNPFMSFHVGDEINTDNWDTSQGNGMFLRVSRVEHILFQIKEKITHKILVFTKDEKRTS